MSTWIEMRCEERGTTVSHKRGCWSDVNAGPMEMAGDTQASVIKTLRLLHADAKKEGWKHMPHGWVCPECIAFVGVPTKGNGDTAKINRCAASRDGECNHSQCPQLRDNEPKNSGRHCPLDTDLEEA